MNWRKWAIALLSVLAIAMVAWLISAQTVGAASLQDHTPKHKKCGNGIRSNYYVSKPKVTNGKVTHPKTDIFGGSYDEGDGNKGTVLGYFVKTDGPNDWEWRAGPTTWIDYGQSVKACIEQKVKVDWHPPGYTWVIVSPAAYRQ